MVALKLHKLEIRVRFLLPTLNRWDWWLNSVTLLLGDKDIWMVQVLLTWLGLDLIVSLLGLESQHNETT